MYSDIAVSPFSWAHSVFGRAPLLPSRSPAPPAPRVLRGLRMPPSLSQHKWRNFSGGQCTRERRARPGVGVPCEYTDEGARSPAPLLRPNDWRAIDPFALSTDSVHGAAVGATKALERASVRESLQLLDQGYVVHGPRLQ